MSCVEAAGPPGAGDGRAGGPPGPALDVLLRDDAGRVGDLAVSGAGGGAEGDDVRRGLGGLPGVGGAGAGASGGHGAVVRGLAGGAACESAGERGPGDDDGRSSWISIEPDARVRRRKASGTLKNPESPCTMGVWK